MKPKLSYRILDYDTKKKTHQPQSNWFPSIALKRKTSKSGRNSSLMPASTFLFPNQERICVQLEPSEEIDKKHVQKTPGIEIEFRLSVPITMKAILNQKFDGTMKLVTTGEDEFQQEIEEEALDVFFLDTNINDHDETVGAAKKNGNGANSTRYHSSSRCSTAHETFAIKEWWKWANDQNLRELLSGELCAENMFSLELSVEVSIECEIPSRGDDGQKVSQDFREEEGEEKISAGVRRTRDAETEENNSKTKDDDDGNDEKANQVSISSFFNVPLVCTRVQRNQEIMSTVAHFQGKLRIPLEKNTGSGDDDVKKILFVSAQVKSIVETINVAKSNIRRKNAKIQVANNAEKKKKKKAQEQNEGENARNQLEGPQKKKPTEEMDHKSDETIDDEKEFLFSLDRVKDEDYVLTRRIFPQMLHLCRLELEQILGAKRITLRMRRGGGGSNNNGKIQYSRTESGAHLLDSVDDDQKYEKAVSFVLIPVEVRF